MKIEKTEKKSVSFPAGMLRDIEQIANDQFGGNISAFLQLLVKQYLRNEGLSPAPLSPTVLADLAKVLVPTKAEELGQMLEAQQVQQPALLEALLYAVYHRGKRGPKMLQIVPDMDIELACRPENGVVLWAEVEALQWTPAECSTGEDALMGERTITRFTSGLYAPDLKNEFPEFYDTDSTTATSAGTIKTSTVPTAIRTLPSKQSITSQVISKAESQRLTQPLQPKDGGPEHAQPGEVPEPTAAPRQQPKQRRSGA